MEILVLRRRLIMRSEKRVIKDGILKSRLVLHEDLDLQNNVTSVAMASGSTCFLLRRRMISVNRTGSVLRAASFSTEDEKLPFSLESTFLSEGERLRSFSIVDVFRESEKDILG